MAEIRATATEGWRVLIRYRDGAYVVGYFPDEDDAQERAMVFLKRHMRDGETVNAELDRT